MSDEFFSEILGPILKNEH